MSALKVKRPRGTSQRGTRPGHHTQPRPGHLLLIGRTPETFAARQAPTSTDQFREEGFRQQGRPGGGGGTALIAGPYPCLYREVRELPRPGARSEGHLELHPPVERRPPLLGEPESRKRACIARLGLVPRLYQGPKPIQSNSPQRGSQNHLRCGSHGGTAWGATSVMFRRDQPRRQRNASQVGGDGSGSCSAHHPTFRYIQATHPHLIPPQTIPLPQREACLIREAGSRAKPER